MPKHGSEATNAVHKNGKNKETIKRHRKQEDIIDITDEVKVSLDQENLLHSSHAGLKMIRFVNSGGKNLCFSNSVTSLLLNTDGIRNKGKDTTTCIKYPRVL